MDRLRKGQAVRGRWESAEDEALKRAIKELGDKCWKKISQRVCGRTGIQCLHRWTKILKPGLIKGPWTDEEDQKLKNWVSQEGPNKWSDCAKIIPGRNCKQCRERWFNHLAPGVKKGGWSLDEDATIFNIFHAFGPKWAFISKFLPGRTENSIKNRFYSTLRSLENKATSLEKINFEMNEETSTTFSQLSFEPSQTYLGLGEIGPSFQMEIQLNTEKMV